MLAQLNADSDIALLHSLEAAADLAATVYTRDKALLDAEVISKAQVDTDAGDLKSKRAQVAQQHAVVQKKTIRAPFAGKLGITTVNPGQYLNPADKLVTLQTIDPIYIDFFVPQQQLPQVSIGQKVKLTSDATGTKVFTGKINAINPKIDPSTRNVQIEATMPNAKRQLLPGMFATVKVNSGDENRYLTLPQTAITFNPYGDTVFVVKATDKKDEKGNVVNRAQQVFVTTGPTRGDQVAILKGIEAGDEVVTSGQVKLKNGAPVVVNNTVSRRTTPTRRYRNTRHNHELHRPIHPQARACDDDQPADPGAGRPLARRDCRQAISEDAERCRHDQHRLLRRRRADRCGLHHAAARRRDRAGAGHRLPVVDQRFWRLGDHRDAAPQLRRQSRADRDQHAGQLGAQPVAAGSAAAGADGAGRADHRRDVHGLLQRSRWPTTTSPTTWCASSSRNSIRSKVCRPPKFLVRARSRCAHGSIRPRWRRTASPPPTCAPRSATTTTSRRSATTKGQMVSVDLTAGTSLHSVDEFKKLVVRQQDGAIVRLEDVATVVAGRGKL